jgi:Zn-dependent protease
VNLDASWLLLAILIAWTLASGFFSSLTHGLPHSAYWAMGVASTIGLLLSIVFHEMSHSLVARHYGLPILGIALFIFGGVAEMTSEPARPRDELLMAAAGPAASFVLSALCFGAFALVGIANGGPTIAGVLWYLGVLNGVLAIFNLIAAFPPDRGRVLLAALWGWRGDYLLGRADRRRRGQLLRPHADRSRPAADRPALFRRRYLARPHRHVLAWRRRRPVPAGPPPGDEPQPIERVPGTAVGCSDARSCTNGRQQSRRPPPISP